MTVIDRTHRAHLAELANSTRDMLNQIGPKAETPEEEQAVARVWLALQKPVVEALNGLDQINLPFSEAEEVKV